MHFRAHAAFVPRSPRARMMVTLAEIIEAGATAEDLATHLKEMCGAEIEVKVATDQERPGPSAPGMILGETSLSFLGLGIQPPTADWGSMVRENAGAITFGIFTPLWPAGAIAFLTVGVNLIVDWFLHIASGLDE